MEYREYSGDEACGTVLSIPKKLVVKCADGGVVLEEVQFAGGKKIRGADAINGRKIQAGQVLQ
jgi:methionyl-tRNA formyltransferase